MWGENGRLAGLMWGKLQLHASNEVSCLHYKPIVYELATRLIKARHPAVGWLKIKKLAKTLLAQAVCKLINRSINVTKLWLPMRIALYNT